MARPRSRQSPRIQQLRWDGAIHTFSQAAGSSAQTMVTDGGTETLMRIRGELVAWVDGLEVPAVAASFGIGALVVQAGQGVTVNSQSITDAQAPWLFYETWTLGYEEYVTDVIAAQGLMVFRKTIDVKAQRILRPGREVQLVVQNSTILGALSANIVFNFRALLGEH